MTPLISTLFLIILISKASSSIIDDINLENPFNNKLFTAPHTPCTPLFIRKSLNNTSSSFIGCSSSDKNEAQTGALVCMITEDELNAFTTTPPKNNREVTALLSSSNLTYATIKTLTSPPYSVTSFLIISSSASTRPLTNPASKSPNRLNSTSGLLNPEITDYDWNSNGDGLDTLDLHGIPISMITDEAYADYIIALARKNSNSNGALNPPPLYSAAFSYYMGQRGVSSEDCLSWVNTGAGGDGERNPQCLPLGGQSVWGTFPRSVSKVDDIVMIGTAIDGNSMFHSNVPSSNQAASNTLALLLTARAVGMISSEVKERMVKNVAFGFFQGESYGFIGSRRFFKETVSEDGGFDCKSESMTSINNSSFHPKFASCLNPLRPSLAFTEIGDISSMIVLDQVGLLNPVNDTQFYSHGYNKGVLNSVFEIESILLKSNDDGYNVVKSKLSGSNTLPPTPLSSLISLSKSESVTGVVLSGYNDRYLDSSYNSMHATSGDVSVEAICKAATIAARTAVASAMISDNLSADEAVIFAGNAIPSVSQDDDIVNELTTCLFKNGNCDLIIKALRSEINATTSRLNFNTGGYSSFGTPPNYHIGVYSFRKSQAYIVHDGLKFGASSVTGEEFDGYIDLKSSALEAGIHGLLDMFLGGGLVNGGEGGGRGYCERREDCSATLCVDNSYAICNMNNTCSCKSSHYHIATDNGIESSVDLDTQYFEINNEVRDTPLYTEPNWSNVGVAIFNDPKGGNPGLDVWACIVSAVVLVVSFWGCGVLKEMKVV